jgi:hypothetical protein
MAGRPAKGTVENVSTAADRRRRTAVTDEDIARRAYELYERRGGGHGRDVDDWLEAERELKPRRRKADQEES